MITRDDVKFSWERESADRHTLRGTHVRDNGDVIRAEFEVDESQMSQAEFDIKVESERLMLEAFNDYEVEHYGS